MKVKQNNKSRLKKVDFCKFVYDASTSLYDAKTVIFCQSFVFFT